MKALTLLSHELRLLVVALQFLTRLPMPALSHYQAEWLQQSARYFPLAGLVVGGLTACVFALLFWWFTPWVAAIGSTAFSIRLTGAFHEDGLADTCDGLGGGFTRESSLQIMKDSRLGTYGTLGLVLTLGLKIAFLASLPLTYALVALVLAHGLSRFFSIILLNFMSYGGDIEHAKAKPLAQHLSLMQAGAALIPLLPALWLASWFLPWPLYFWLLPLVLMLLACLYMARLLYRKLGGFTGDGLGATQQLTELAFYAGVAALWL